MLLNFQYLFVPMRLQEQKNGQKMVTVPKSLAKAMGWEKGYELEFSVKNSNTLEIQSLD